ncbi:hypothetical protein LTR37_017023 [Vermiconidia calcicola]|uniref:Uncharacterized protein n=1 Tax=Vermiconidia calcicola TaxID=1690605 RepID=A0ACC3ML09_9PEZI|nr:hypothetical protein LTR37_017023 [Vermiconidia calcicola]
MASSSNGEPKLKDIATEILQSEINNIIHDVLIHRHRDHKLMLMNLDPITKLPLCDRCNLPRLLDPPLANSVRGAISDPPNDTAYCDRKPWSRRPGHDIYGNPFPKGDVTGRPPTKKEKEAAKKKDAGDGTPASNEGGEANGTAPPSPSADDNPSKNENEKKGEKKASKIDEKLKKGEYIPWQTCPNCKRSLLIIRFAKHLEQCMGLSGRAASRNAMAKMNGSTPAGSRGGTPGPSQEGGKDEDEEEDEKIKGPGGVRKKVLKKGLNSKLKKAEKDGKGTNTPASGGDGKRDREEMLLGEEGDEEENVHVKKRQKLQRVESMASVGSQSTAAPPSAVEMERAESNDGSFVDDGGGSFAED